MSGELTERAHGGDQERGVFERSTSPGTEWPVSTDRVGDNGGRDENLVIVTSDHETGHLWGAGSCDAQDFVPLTGAEQLASTWSASSPSAGADGVPS